MTDIKILPPEPSLFQPGEIPVPVGSDPRAISVRDRILAELAMQDAMSAGTVSFFPKAFTHAAFPYKQPRNPDGTLAYKFVRRSKFLTLTLSTANECGLPYGSLVRLLLAYMTNQAMRNQDRTIDLCQSITELLRLFQMQPTGGKAGTITRLRHQLDALSSTTANFEWAGCVDDYKVKGKILMPIIEQAVFWEKSDGSSNLLDGSFVTLSDYFYQEIISSAVPVDMRALIALKKSPLAMDLYTFLTYRMSYLKDRQLIPWVSLYGQFGFEYARVRDFKTQLTKTLPMVTRIYDKLHLDLNDQGLMLYPSPTHIPRLKPMRKDGGE